mmetsp:Transcript_5192/g.14672  ORF Transcript_5192/g.14672 Transcript_5192/m.14672 type:complete len:248 (+) Transcript_5192:32-775(+)
MTREYHVWEHTPCYHHPEKGTDRRVCATPSRLCGLLLLLRLRLCRRCLRLATLLCLAILRGILAFPLPLRLFGLGLGLGFLLGGSSNLEGLNGHDGIRDCLQLLDLLLQVLVLGLQLRDVLGDRVGPLLRPLCRLRLLVVAATDRLKQPLEHLRVLRLIEEMLVLHRGEQRHVVVEEVGVFLVVLAVVVSLHHLLHGLEQFRDGGAIDCVLLRQVEDGLVELVEVLGQKCLVVRRNRLEHGIEIHGS